MQFISVNIVILKKGGAGVNGQAFMEVMVPVRSVYLCHVKTMIFSKMTVSGVLTIIMTNMKP